MTTARIVPFEPADLVALDPRASEQGQFAALGGVERTAALCDYSGDYAYSVIADNRPVACIGVTRYWEGVGAAWAYLSPESPRYWKTIHRGVVDFLDGAFIDEFWRIETVVDMRCPAAHRWALRLGFLPEGLKRKHGYDRADFMGYARVSQ